MWLLFETGHLHLGAKKNYACYKDVIPSVISGHNWEGLCSIYLENKKEDLSFELV